MSRPRNLLRNMDDKMLEQKRERVELVKKEVKKHNRPIWEKIGVLACVVAVLVTAMIKLPLPGWLDMTMVAVLFILVLWVQGLLESLKTTFEFETPLSEDDSITDKKWFLYLVPVMSFVLLIAIFMGRFWAEFIKPQMLLWGISITAGLVISLLALRLLYRYEPGLRYEIREESIKIMSVYFIGTWLLGIFLTSMSVVFFLRRLLGESTKSAIKISGNEYEIQYEGQLFSFGKNRYFDTKIESGDTVSFEVVKTYPFLLFREIKKQQAD